MLTGDLFATERLVCEAFPSGASVDVSDAEDRTVRADVLTSLLLQSTDAISSRSAAVRLTGARIVGALEFPYADISSMVWFRRCEFEEAVQFEGTTRRVVLNSCRLPGFTARGLHVSGQLSLYDSQVDGRIALLGAQVDGELNISQVRINGRDGDAIRADKLAVAGNVLAVGLDAHGQISLPGAEIAGTVDLTGARIAAPGKRALTADRLEVSDHLILDSATVDGEIVLRGARIDGQLILDGAHLNHPGGYALWASAITVGDTIYLWKGFTAHGPIVLRRARVNGAVIVEVDGPVHINASTLTADRVDVAIGAADESSLDLRHATVRQLIGTPARWPAGLYLDGLVYDRLEPTLPADQRLECLRRNTSGYLPQPYEQLAAAYRRLGHDADARHVLLAKQRMRRTTLTRLSRIWGYIQDATVGYGYQPMRAVGWLLGLLTIGTVTFAAAPPAALHPGETPHFNAFAYTLDLLFPIIDFGQQSAWNPTGAQQWLSYLLIAAGWVLATAVAAGATRALSRT